MKTENYLGNQQVISLFFCFIFFIASHTFCCGGGVVPYIPTQSGASNTTSGQLFLLEKGASVEMFDVKKLQPLFRSIVLSGNERKLKKDMEKIVSKNQKTADKDSTKTIQEDNAISKHDHKNAIPVLNLHRIH